MWLRVLAVMFWAIALAVAPGPLRAQEAAGLARLAGPALLSAEGADLRLDLPMTLPVPWRARLWADPPRAVLDFRRLVFGARAPGPVGAAVALRMGEAGGGWSRLVIELSGPMTFAELGLTTDPATGAARLQARLVPATAEAFDRQRLALDPAGLAPPAAAQQGQAGGAGPALRQPFRVMLDPGHGGVDPGAVHGALTEAALVKSFARELAEALRRAGGFEVLTTRDEDHFVSLEARVRMAREAGAQVFLSLHADSLEYGDAQGIALFTLAPEASDSASARLAEFHDRANLLGGGADMTGIEDEIAMVLLDMAWTETRPATERLVEALLQAIRAEGLALHPRPWQRAAFSVLRAPDIPSVLIELGFMSSARDRARMTDPAWRARMVAALVAALEGWREDEGGRRLLRRQ